MTQAPNFSNTVWKEIALWKFPIDLIASSFGGFSRVNFYRHLQLRIWWGLESSELFTDFTESAFYSPDGLEATAPVFAGAPELPSPLGQVLVTWMF